MLLEWLKARGVGQVGEVQRQGQLFASPPFDENAPTIRSVRELDSALEHLEYAIFRRFQNQLTRAERSRLDNTIDNALFKVERYLLRSNSVAEDQRRRFDEMRHELVEARDHANRRREQARRADAKLSQLTNLTPDAFEEFVAEVFETLGYGVERMGGTGDEGIDLRVSREGLCAIVQCKYHTRGVIGSPELQRFLGSIHHARCHKGYFVTTRTFSLAAEKFARENPIELIDGPRLVELVRQALGPVANEEHPSWF
jgi:restriction system protein